MRTKFILTVVALVFLYTIINYYIGLRFWQSFGDHNAAEQMRYYWIIFAVLASSYFIGRVSTVCLPGHFSDNVVKLGSYWLAIDFYAFFFWLMYDITVRLGAFIGIFSHLESFYSLPVGVIILISASGTVLYGVRQAGRLQVKHYEVQINKHAQQCTELHAVVITDLHLGLLVGRERLMKVIKAINALNPDLVLLPGDIIDENIGAFVESGMPEMLREIQSRLGVFGVLGSHEYIYGHSEKALRYLKRSGIMMLRDSYIALESGVQIVGRDDVLREQLVGTPRRPLAEILKYCDRQQAIILLDHQPVGLSEAELQGVDLQLSGHTHHGQIFPLNFLTQWLFEKDWGYLRKGAYQLIVSSGFGTWGPPIRVGTVSEILDITIRFNK